MTSREIVERTLDFSGPERIAMALPSPYPNDFVHAGAAAAAGWKPQVDERTPEGRFWTDEWGVRWHSLTDFDKGEVIRGALETWDNLDDYRPPDLADPARYVRAARTFAEHPDRFRVGSMPGFVFSIARKLRRMDNYLGDLVLEPDRIARLHRMLRDILAESIVQWSVAGADAVMFAEDWGMQDRLLIDPAMWRRVFKPDFAVLCETARRNGLRVLMHSCGYIRDIIPDLVDVGIDCLQLDQPRLSGLRWLDETVGGRVSFWCPVDIQTTLQSRSAKRVEEDARLMIEILARRGGGFIAGYYGGNEAIGVDPALQDTACRAFVRHGTTRAGKAA